MREKTLKRKRLLFNVLEIIFIILMIFSSIKIIMWYVENRKNSNTLEEISTAINIEDNKYNINFSELKRINSDTIAWLKINGTQIEYPVVKTTDNNYYLSHGFDKTYNSAGWIFADYRNKFDGTDKNIIIYGHNRRDGSMFGSAKNVLQKEWYEKEENRYIEFITEKENAKYQVFSIYQIENEEYYIQTEFKEAEFSKFLNKIKSRSINDFNVEVTQDDKILTISTCANDNRYRVVIHAKRIVE